MVRESDSDSPRIACIPGQRGKIAVHPVASTAQHAERVGGNLGAGVGWATEGVPRHRRCARGASPPPLPVRLPHRLHLLRAELQHRAQHRDQPAADLPASLPGGPSDRGGVG